jgi:hypothetical protein
MSSDSIIAWHEGVWAFDHGDSDNRNPYPYGSIAWERWEMAGEKPMLIVSATLSGATALGRV